MTFGTILTSARQRADLTQDELAKKVGISRALLSLLELDRRTVPPDSVVALVDALQLEGAARAELMEAAHLTHGTDVVRQMLTESQAQVRFLSDLCGLGVPVTTDPKEAKRYGSEAAEKLAILRRVNQRLYDQRMEAEGKRAKPHASGVEEIPDVQPVRAASPFAPQRRKKARKQ